MKINRNPGAPAPQAGQTSQPGRPKVVLATSFNRVREMLDIDGNVIDPRTKRIIRRAGTNGQ